MRNRNLYVIVAVTFAISLLAFQFTKSTSSSLDYIIRAKYHVRAFLGLPKDWPPVPAAPQINGRSPVECPPQDDAIVIVTGGQSNAANTNSVRSETKSGDGVFDFFDGRCFVSSDPVPGASGDNGSLWPLLGLWIAGSTSRPVVMLHGAIGGTQVEDWLDRRSGYLESLTNRIMYLRSFGFEPDLVIWHQGETDAAVVSDMGYLKENFTELMKALHLAAPKGSIYLFQASKCLGMGRENGIRQFTLTQALVADELDFVIRGLNTDSLGNDLRWDTCHFNAAGRKEIVSRVGPNLIVALRVSK